LKSINYLSLFSLLGVLLLILYDAYRSVVMKYARPFRELTEYRLTNGDINSHVHGNKISLIQNEVCENETG
jgi:hypothetical protein